MRLPNKQLKTGIILNYINMGLGSLIPVFYTPIMLRILGQEEYGLYKLSSVATSYLGLVSLGLGAAITRYIIKAKVEGGQEAESKMLGLFLLIFRAIALLSFTAGIFLIFIIDSWYDQSLTSSEIIKMKWLMFIMVCNMAFSFSVAPYVSVVSAREKFLFLECMSIINTCVTPLVNLVALFLGYASIGLAITSFAITFIVRVLYFLYVSKKLHLHPCYKNLPTHLLKEIFIFSFWIFVANIVSKLYATTDIMMIGAIPALATVGVAVYNVGIILDGIIGSISAGLSSLLTPKINKLVFSQQTNEALTDLSIRVGRLQCHIAAPFLVGFIVFGKPLICFYIGSNYINAYWIAICVGVPKMIVLAQSACLSIVIAKNQHRFRSIVYLFIAILNAVGTWLVLEHWGIIGAAFMSGLSFFIGHGLFMNWFYWKRSGLNIIKFWRQVSRVYIVPILACAFGIFASNFIDLYQLHNLLFSAIVFSIVLATAQYVLCFNSYEKQLITSPFKTLFNKITHKNN